MLYLINNKLKNYVLYIYMCVCVFVCFQQSIPRLKQLTIIKQLASYEIHMVSPFNFKDMYYFKDHMVL